MVEAIREILAGRVFVSPRVSAELLGSLGRSTRPEARTPIENLTDRELQVFRGAIGSGLNTRAIAGAAEAESQVHVHRAHIKEKLGEGRARVDLPGGVLGRVAAGGTPREPGCAHLTGERVAALGHTKCEALFPDQPPQSPDALTRWIPRSAKTVASRSRAARSGVPGAGGVVRGKYSGKTFPPASALHRCAAFEHFPGFIPHLQQHGLHDRGATLVILDVHAGAGADEDAHVAAGVGLQGLEEQWCRPVSRPGVGIRAAEGRLQDGCKTVVAGGLHEG